jgi:Mg-chelatase subunit ChlD
LAGLSIWLCGFSSSSDAVAQNGVAMLLSADARGQVDSCGQSCGKTASTGLAVRASLVKQYRVGRGRLLLVDSGNALFGVETMSSKGELMLRVYAAIGYDAINLSYRDFRLGKQVTADLVHSGTTPFVSANLTDEFTEKLIAAPYVVHATPVGKVAIVGVTQAPSGIDVLPHLQAQLAGIRIEPPLKALAKWLPKAKAAADHVVLLYYGSWAGLKPIKEQFGNELNAILVGGTRHEYLPEGTVPPIVGTADRGQQLALVKLDFSGEQVRTKVEQISADANIAPDPEIEQLIDRYAAAETLAEPVAPSQPPVQPDEYGSEGRSVDSADSGEYAQPVSSDQIIIGTNIRLGMSLPEAARLLGFPDGSRAADGAAGDKVWMTYPRLGLSIGATRGGMTLEAIVVRENFAGQFANGLRIGDPWSEVVARYGMPVSHSPERLAYPTKGIAFHLRDHRIVAADLLLVESAQASEGAQPGEVIDWEKALEPSHAGGRAPSQSATETDARSSQAGSNEVITLSVEALDVVSDLGGIKAGAADAFVVLSLRLGHSGKGPGRYVIPQIADNLFLIAGKGYTAEIAVERTQPGADVLPAKLELSKDSAEVAGKVAFRIRKKDQENLSLAFVDPRFKDIIIPLRGSTPEASRPAEYGSYQKGKLLVSVYGMECEKTACFVDVGVKSGIRNTLLEYDLASYVFAVLDEHEYIPLGDKTAPYSLHDLKVFSPNLERRGFYRLPVPDEHRPLGLYMALPDGHHFSIVLMPGQAKTLPPALTRFSDGSAAEVIVLGFNEVAEADGLSATTGNRMVALDVLVSPAPQSRRGLNLEPLKLFALGDRIGNRWKAKSLRYPERRPAKPLFPTYSGMTRRFGLVYELPKAQQGLLLAYSGFKEAKQIPLALKTLAGEVKQAQAIEPGFTAYLAKDKPEPGKVFSPQETFDDGTHTLYLLMSSNLPEKVTVKIEWKALEVEGKKAGEQLSRPKSMRFAPGQRGVFTFQGPKAGFEPGKYRVELTIPDQPLRIIPFEIVSLYPDAERIRDESQVPVGFNIALSALGGKVERWSSQYDGGAWAAANLNDGKAVHWRWRTAQLACYSCGWSSKGREAPQEVVLSFYETRSARIQAITIDTVTEETSYAPGRAVKDAEIWVSQEGPESGFVKIAGARLGNEPGKYSIRLPDTLARFVKIVFLSNHGGRWHQAGEIEIIENATQQASILHDFPINLASPTLGGGLVRWSSQTDHHRVHHLIDGTVETVGWYARGKSLPQEFLFQFDRDQEPLIEAINVNPRTDRSDKTWAKRIQVAVSRTGYFDGFDEVGEFVLSKEPVLQSFKVGKHARFVRLRILETQGGQQGATLGEVQLIEGWEPGYQSIILRRDTPETVESAVAEATAPIDEDAVLEQEPNDDSTQANTLELERFGTGQISPLGEKDIWALQIPGAEPVITRFDLKGIPNIRTSYKLLGKDGAVLQHFDPSSALGAQAAFEWKLEPGDQLIEVTEPPVSVVVIWDTSGSMEGSTGALQEAVESYLEQLRPEDRVALIRFSDDVEVLAPLGRYSGKMRSSIAGKFSARGGTALYDAVLQGIELLDGVAGNRAILLMTDGIDTASKKHNADLWRMLDKQRMRVYSIGLGGHWSVYLPEIANTGRRLLSNISKATDGKAYIAPSKGDLKAIYQGISDELRQLSRYYVKPEIVRTAPPTQPAESPHPPAEQECVHKADIVFLIDGTDSMGDEVKAVKKGLSAFVLGLKKQRVDARFAIVMFGGAPEIVLDFTKHHATVQEALGKISVSNRVTGFQENHNVNPEAGLEAIRSALNAGSEPLRHKFVGGDGRLHYRADARINLILVTDEDSDRPHHPGNRLPGHKSEDPSGTLEGTDWQLEVDRTAALVIRNRAFVNLLISPRDAPSTKQYGDPASDVAGPDFLNFDPKATLAALLSGGAARSLQAQVLSADLVGRSFDIRQLEKPEFIDHFYAAKVDEIVKHCLPKAPAPRGPGHLSVAATRDVLVGRHPTQIELILDASGSMRERKRKIDGRLKIDVAKDVMHELVEGLPEGMEVALRVYGHRVREGRKGDCLDTELLVPFGKLDKDRLHEKISGMQALGTTPLAYSLLKAGEDFSPDPGEKILILVTDGKEECKMDPAFAARTLVKEGLKVRVDVVGFALADAETKADMLEVAAITGGRFYDAQDRAELLAALRKAMALPFEVFDGEGQAVATGTTGEGGIQLMEGVYTVKVQSLGGALKVFEDVRIGADQYTRLELHLERGGVRPHAHGPYSKEEMESVSIAGVPMRSVVMVTDASKLDAKLRETPQGLRVERLTSRGLAQNAGLQLEDLLAEMDGKPLRQELDLRRAIEEVRRGEKATVLVTVRRGGDHMALEFRGHSITAWDAGRSSEVATGRSDRVRDAQRWLTQIGFNPGPVDGAWGPRTERAVRAFQGWYPRASLDKTGQLDEKTYDALEAAVRQGVKKPTKSRSSPSSHSMEQRRRKMEARRIEQQRRAEAERKRREAAEAQRRNEEMMRQGLDTLRNILRW